MQTYQHIINATHGQRLELHTDADLVLAFGARAALQTPGLLRSIQEACPHATVVGCSTAGEIAGASVLDNSVVLTCVKFAKTRVRTSAVQIGQSMSSAEAGAKLAHELIEDRLCHVFVLSDGVSVNGTELAQGFARSLPPHVALTGGLSGDGTNFQETVVIADGECRTNTVSAIGFYGESLQVGYGSLGGWDPFGPERVISRSKGNILYELDGRSALALYKEYLGAHAANLPAAGLLFPLSLHIPGVEHPIVRTILGVDESEGSITFAGDMPTGVLARLMKANFDRLIDGAHNAAELACSALAHGSSELAILISCVGRKLVLKQRIEEEVESAQSVLGQQSRLCGFYSYGEIAPFQAETRCELHNQTMTITALREDT